MAVLEVCEHLVEEIARAAVPQVMMWIDDRQVRFDDRFTPPIKPGLIGGE